MKISSIRFERLEPKLKIPKLVMIYMSNKHSQIIVAPYFKDDVNGVNYEQPNCETLHLNTSHEEFGKAIKSAFHKFSVKRRENKAHKKSDWPAFKMSREKTMRGFEENYRRISVQGVNESNLTWRIETIMNLPIRLELCSTVSSGCDPAELGNRVMKIFQSEITQH